MPAARQISGRLKPRGACPWGALGCMIIVASLADAACSVTAPAEDATTTYDAPPSGPVEIRASIDPTTVRPDDEILLQVLVLGFRLVELNEPAQPGRGHYLVTLVDEQGNGIVSLFEGSSREQRFRLVDFPGFVFPGAGRYGLRLSLHLNDGSPASPEAWVTLYFELSDEG